MEDSVSISEASVGDDVGEESVGVGGKYGRSVLKIFGCRKSSLGEDILCLGRCLLLQHLASRKGGGAGILRMVTLESPYRRGSAYKITMTQNMCYIYKRRGECTALK